MTCAGDLSAALSTRLGCSMADAREHLKFVFEHADDPNFSMKFAKEYEWDHAFAIYHDVVKFLKEKA